jgi:hypothetical protein
LNLPEDIELLNNLNQIHTFEELSIHYESISRALVSRVLGTTGDRKLRDECVALQARITKHFVKSRSSLPNEFVKALDKKDIENTYRIGGEMILEYDTPDGFESMIQSLIHLCDGALRCTFTPNEIHAARATRSIETPKADILAAEPLEVEKNHSTFVCPISYDNETDPVIMICTPVKPLLAGLEKNITDQIIDCPLNALKIKSFI